MKKVAVFGKPGSGKSTFSRKLASATGIELHALDAILYTPGGEQVDRETFVARHDSILSRERWIIDGLGPMTAFNKRLIEADTLIYIDLPYATSYWLVTKRLLKGLLVKPEGWPDGSSVLKGTLESYRVLRLCPGFWNEDFQRRLEQLSSGKACYRVRSLPELNGFVGKYVG